MKYLGLIVISWFFFSCATNKPLATRGLSPEERRYYIIQNGYGLTQEVKDAFLDGYPVKGMSKDLVFQLFGPADREILRGDQWEYLNSRAKIITGVRFKDNLAIEIIGDPRGGLEPPKATTE